MSEEEGSDGTIKCSLCVRDLTKVTRINCVECTAILCIKCFQFGGESGAHKRGHNYEFHCEDDDDTLFNKLWQRDDEQKLITTVHRFKLGNWEEVSQVLSKAGRKRVAAEVQRHFQLYFVLSTLGRTAMKEKEWIERRDQFRDDPAHVYGDPSGRELYYHAVIEALRACKDLPNINDRTIVEQIDGLVKEHFESLKRTERKRKASEIGAALSKARTIVRTEAFPYGDSDDDAWWEKIFKEPREKKELDRYYEEDSVCTEEKCMAEEVESDDFDLKEILKMMKNAGLEDHESLGAELKALKLSALGLEGEKNTEDRPREISSPLERPEPERKRAKIELPDASDRDHLAVDLHREVLMETIVKDKKIIKELEGKKSFIAEMHTVSDCESDDGDDLASSYDEVEDVDEDENDEAEYATDSDSEGSPTVFDYEAYEARMKEAGYQSDELYSDWDEEAKEAITVKLRELAQKGLLADSSEEGDDENEDKEEEEDVDVVGGLEESAEESASMDDDDRPCASGLQRAPRDSVPCGLEEEAETSHDDEDDVDDEEEASESSDVSSDDEGDSTSSSFASEFESETEQLDRLFGASAMRIPKGKMEQKKTSIRSVKFYELGSDNEYHTMDEETAALPLAEMTFGENRRKRIAKKLRRQQDKYYGCDPLTGRLIAKMPPPPMSPDLEAEVQDYGHWEFSRWKRHQKAAAAAAGRSPRRGAAADDHDRTPEARFGDDSSSQDSQDTSSSRERSETFTREHPAFQKYLMEHIVDDMDTNSGCSSSDCESISSETGTHAMEFLGHPIDAAAKIDEDVDDDAEDASEDDEEENEEPYEDADDGEMEHDGEEEEDVFHQASENPEISAVPSDPRTTVSRQDEVKEEESDEDRGDARVVTGQEMKDEDLSVKSEDDSVEKPEKPSNEVTSPNEEGNDDEAEDSDGALYKLAEEQQKVGDDAEDKEVNTDDEEGEVSPDVKEANDEDCVRDIEGLVYSCACASCTKHRWTKTLGEKEHDLWMKIMQSGLSMAEVKEVLKKHFVVDESDSSDASTSEDYYSEEDEEQLEVYVDAVEINDGEWKIDLTSAESPIPVQKDDYRFSGDDNDEESEDDEPEEADVFEKSHMEEELMDVGDETLDRADSSLKDETLVEEESLYGLEEELDEDEEEDDKDKTPPMLQGNIKKEMVDPSADETPYELPRSPILVIKKIQARGRTNLKVETRPRTPADDERRDGAKDDDDKHPSPSQPPLKKKKLPREVQLLFKDNEIRNWEESQAQNLKERASKALGTTREKSTRCGVEVSLVVDDATNPRRNKKGKREMMEDKPTCSKYRAETPETSLDDLPRSSRRAKTTKDSARKASGSPKKTQDKKKGIKRVAEPVESEKEESSGDDDDEETPEGDEGKSPQKKRRKHKRIAMSKRERKAKWDKKIQNRRAREEQKVKEKKAVVSSIEFFEQHERTFFSNCFRRIAFDFEDHGFRNRVNFKSFTNDIFNMGYNQERDDFDVEYYNDAEQIISRLNITNTEGGLPVDMENEIKLAKVDRYLRVLQERRALRNQAAEYETIPDFLQLCKRMNSERRKLKDIMRSKPEEEKFDAKLSSVLARDELMEMKQAKTRLLKLKSRTEKLRELHDEGVTTLEGHESIARFKPRTKFGRTEEQKKVDEGERGTLLEFDEKIAGQLEKLSLISGDAADEDRAIFNLRSTST